MTRRTNHRKQAPWMASVRVGDVLRSARGTFRVVRSVSRYDDGQLHCVTFVIRHGSWTDRPLTTMNYTDLMGNGYEPVIPRVRSKMATPLDAEIARHVADHRLRELSAADVVGIA